MDVEDVEDAPGPSAPRAEDGLAPEAAPSNIHGDDEPERTETPLCVVWHKTARSSRLGAAWLQGGEIHCLEAAERAPHFEQLQALKRELDPSVLVAPSSSDEAFLEMLSTDVATGADGHYLVQLVKPAECSVAASRRALSFLRTSDCPDSLPDDELGAFHYTKLREDGEMLRAVGGLLASLAREGTPPIVRIVPGSVGCNVMLDPGAFTSLGIFERHSHPSAYGGRAKEGMSLFALMNRTRSKAGDVLLRSWFFSPTYDEVILAERHDAVAFFTAAGNGELLEHMRQALGGVKAMGRTLQRVAAGARAGDLREVVDHCQAFRRVHELLRSLNPPAAGEAHAVRALRVILEASDVAASLERLRSLIASGVNFEACKAEPSRVVISEGINKDRDQLMQMYRDLDATLHECTELEHASASGVLGGLADELLAELKAVYVPQFGFFMRAPAALLEAIERLPEERRPDISQGVDGFQAGDGRVYCKSGTMKHLDMHVGDVLSQIIDHDLAYVRELEERVVDKAEKLLWSLEVLAELDALCALAHAANDLCLCRPTLTRGCELELRGAWHPLVRPNVEHFIPNDCSLGAPGAPSTLVLTGPNGSGKSVLLKQVAIVAFLAQVGSFVPAQSATIGVVDRILCRIFTRESAALAKSTFMLDLHQASLMLSASTERSLLILDEFGKGTHFADGLSFLASFLLELDARRERRPKLLVATHFTELLHLPSMRGVPLQTKTMQAMVERVDGAAEESVHLLYKMIDGQSTSSFAAHVGRAVGVPEQILARAAEIGQSIASQQPIAAAAATSAQDEAERHDRIVRALLKADLAQPGSVGALLGSLLPECS